MEDDSADGFKSLKDAWTLFAPSYKKGNPEQRGRFNLGEKLVLALCRKAEILSTTGGVRFDKDGRHGVRKKRPAGSLFRGELRLSDAELEEIKSTLLLLLPPAGIRTTAAIGEWSFDPIPTRAPMVEFRSALRTEDVDDEGNLRRTTRKGTVTVIEPDGGETPFLFEMGIPVVELDCAWHVNVGQKVPLTLDRSSVLPSFAKAVRVEVLNNCHNLLTKEDATESWVKEAAGDERAEAEAVTTTLDLRFGEKRVSYDPTDHEANVRAAAAGYTVVHGGNLSAGEWQNARGAGAISSSGGKFGTPVPFTGIDLTGENTVERDELNSKERAAFDFAEELIEWLLPTTTPVLGIVKRMNDGCVGAYGGGSISLVRRMLRAPLVQGRGSLVAVLIHECSHSGGGHYDRGFLRNLEDFGARTAELALRRPELFDLKGGE